MRENRPAARELLEHAAFVRRLARSLARDEATADDLFQEVYATALARPPADGGHLRAWLRRVVRSVFLDRIRGDARRAARERSVAVRGTAAPANAATERLELQRRLVDAVLGLPEPYRTVVVLRHFEALDNRRIANRLGVPLKTVQTRHRRALAKLRKELGPRDRDRLALIAGGLLVSTKTKLLIVAAALLVLVGAGVVLTPTERDPVAPARSRGEVPPASAVPETVATAATEDAAPDDPIPDGHLRVLVIDETGAPVPGAFLCVDGPAMEEAVRVRTGEDGRARPAARGRVDLSIRDWGRHAPIRLAGRRPTPDEPEIVVRLEPGLTIEGRVLTPTGTPHEMGRVEAVPVAPPGWLGPSRFTARTDRDGTFVLRGLLPGEYRIEVHPNDPAPGFAPDPPPVATAGDRDVEIRLTPVAVVVVVLSDAETGDEIRTWRRIVEIPDDGEAPLVESIGGSDGRIELPPRRGAFRFRVDAEGYASSDVYRFDPADGFDYRVYRIALRPDPDARATLRLRLVDDRGPLPPPTAIYLIRGPLRFRESVVVEDGAAILTLPCRPVRLGIPGTETHCSADFEVDLPRGGDAERTVVVERAGTIHALRPPGPEGDILLFGPDGERRTVLLGRSLSGGWVDLVGVRPGEVTVDFARPDGRHVRRTVTVRPGETVEVRGDG